MNWNGLLEIIVNILNTPAVIAALSAGLLWVLARIFLAKPAWQKYEGAIITGVKLAEKAIPDETPNAGLARADWALKYVLNIYQQARGHAADATLAASIADGIPIVHAQLEAGGGLVG